MNENGNDSRAGTKRDRRKEDDDLAPLALQSSQLEAIAEGQRVLLNTHHLGLQTPATISAPPPPRSGLGR